MADETNEPWSAEPNDTGSGDAVKDGAEDSGVEDAGAEIKAEDASEAQSLEEHPTEDQPAEPQEEAVHATAPQDEAHAANEGVPQSDAESQSDVESPVEPAGAMAAESVDERKPLYADASPRASSTGTAAAYPEASASANPAREPLGGRGLGGDLDRPGLGLLYDVELDATLQFGSKEMLLRDVLELGPGDVVELDRHIAEPVDLVVGDRIVARGEVVVASGNFALRVTEVATPQMRLESIRCLF